MCRSLYILVCMYLYDVTLYIYAIESRRSSHVHLERRKKKIRTVTNVKRVVVLHPRRNIKNNRRKYIQGHMYIY
jgi:protein subunit release factor B